MNIQTPQIKNHSSTFYNKKLYIFGGYDGKKNHCILRVFDTEKNCWLKQIKPGGFAP
jgi:N-acetylneuraminic acid mutarotase